MIKKKIEIYSDEFYPLSIDRIEIDLNIRSNYDEEGIIELSESIKKYGLLNPIRVYEKDDKYVIIFGHRRFLACQRAGRNSINCIISQKPDSVKNIFLQLTENFQREEILSADFEKYINMLKYEYKLSVKEIAEKMNKSEGYLHRVIKAFDTREKNKEIFTKTGFTPTTHDLMILNNCDEETMKEAINMVCENPGDKTKILEKASKECSKKPRINNVKENKDVINYELKIKISKNEYEKKVIFNLLDITKNSDKDLLFFIENSISNYFIDIGYMINR